MHNHIIRHTFLSQHLTLKRARSKVSHRQQLFVRRVAAYRISIRDIEIELRTFERHQITIETFAYHENSVDLSLLHRLTGFRIGVRDQLYIYRRRSLHLMDETA